MLEAKAVQSAFHCELVIPLGNNLLQGVVESDFIHSAGKILDFFLLKGIDRFFVLLVRLYGMEQHENLS